MAKRFSKSWRFIKKEKAMNTLVLDAEVADVRDREVQSRLHPHPQFDSAESEGKVIFVWQKSASGQVFVYFLYKHGNGWCWGGNWLVSDVSLEQETVEADRREGRMQMKGIMIASSFGQHEPATVTQNGAIGSLDFGRGFFYLKFPF